MATVRLACQKSPRWTETTGISLVERYVSPEEDNDVLYHCTDVMDISPFATTADVTWPSAELQENTAAGTAPPKTALALNSVLVHKISVDSAPPVRTS